MKKIAAILVIASFLFSCGDTNKKPERETIVNSNSSTREETVSNLASADYSSLLESYSCDIDVTELAKAMEIPASDLTKTSGKEQVKKALDLSEADIDRASNNNLNDDNECKFELKGFGSGTIGDTYIQLVSEKMSQADIKKNINSLLKEKKDGLEKITKMNIMMADTNDSYVVSSPRYGRVLIYNENHEGVFTILYGTRNANTDRTKEQHEVLTEKMVRLANYLLKKHKK